MKWYAGNIEQAVAASKAKGAIFVVYIEGTDGNSKNITDLINHGVLGQNLEKEHFVAIKIEAGSLPHRQFSEIFKETSVPSIYFIGKSSVPLDIITGDDALDNISERIEHILSKGGITVTKSAADFSETLLQKEQASGGGDVVCKNDVCQIKPNTEVEIVPEAVSDEKEPNELTSEEKIERAKELIEKKREQKEREERENEQQKEIERRKMGQNVQQLKKWQEDQELKQILEDREKEKRENQLARERVLAQIAQDRAERQAKTQPPSVPADGSKPVLQSARVNSNNTRLQFRLPDGSSNTKEFANSDTLQNVVTYIKNNLPFNNFKLSTTFPRREFTTNDYSQSLVDLQLSPTAVILVLPLNSGAVSTNPGGTFSALIWGLFAPIFSLFGYLRNVIFGRNGRSTGTKRPSQDHDDLRPAVTKRRIVRDSTVVKRQGNVHRLTDRSDSDEEGNTWNGNSTQQM